MDKDEEIKQNIPTRQIILDKEEGEIMLPSSSTEQDLLWDELYDAVNDQDLSREIKWFSVPDMVRKFLSLKEISDKIKKIGAKFNLNDFQINKLAKNIKYIFIRELLLTDFISKIAEELKIEKNLANQIGQDVKKEIFVPQKEYLLKLYPPSSIPQSVAVADKSSSVQTSEIKRENVKAIDNKSNVSFKSPMFKREEESKSFTVSAGAVIEDKQKTVMPEREKKESIFKKEESPIKFKVETETPVNFSGGVSLDHLYEKLNLVKDKQKEFLEEVIAKKEEELPKAWQVEEHKNIKTEKQKDIKTENLGIRKQENVETLKREKIEAQIVKSKEIIQKPPIRTMKKDIEKYKT